MARNSSTIAVIDLGTYRCCCLVAQVAGPQQLDVIGIGSRRTDGIRRGKIVNLEALVSTIKDTVEQAKSMAGCTIEAALATVPAAQVRSFTSRGVVTVAGNDKIVRRKDLERVLKTVHAVQIPDGQTTLHALPQEYTLDGQEEIQDPVGMTGSRLEASVHVVTVPKQAAQHVVSALETSRVEVVQLVFPLLAAGEAVLTPEEREQGVFLIDIGGGTTDMALFERGALWFTGSIPIAGELITNDISIGLRTPVPDAESIKRTHARAVSGGDEDFALEVPTVGGGAPRLVAGSLLTQVVGPRVQEIFELIQHKIERAGLEGRARAGAVLIGGSANLEGVLEIAEQTLGMPVRVGVPQGVGGLVEDIRGPSFATPVGLARWELLRARGEREKSKRRELPETIKNRFSKVADWFGQML